MPRTETVLSGARFHRAGHVTNVPHVRKTTVISAPVLTRQIQRSETLAEGLIEYEYRAVELQ